MMSALRSRAGKPALLACYLDYIHRTTAPALLWNALGGIFDHNAGAAALAGNPAAREALAAGMERAVRESAACACETDLGRFVAVPLLEADGSADTALAIAADFPDLPRILHGLQAGRRYFSQVIHLLPQIVLTAHPDGTFDYASRRWNQVTGTRTFGHGVHAAVLANVDRRDVDSFTRRWGRGTAGGKAFSFEFRLTTAGGARWYEVRSEPVFDHGRLSMWIAALSDVDEAVAARGALARYRDRLDEQQIAHVLQRAMLPIALPNADGVGFDVTYRAARDAALVGGDWYDAFEVPGGRIALTVGDVAGHGLNAAVAMGHIRESIRGALLGGQTPAEALTHANRAACSGRGGMVTAFAGLLDPLGLTLDYANAGHPPPLVVRANEGVTALETGDVPLGVDGSTRYESQTALLANARALAAYTDGLVEVNRDAAAGELELRRALEGWARGGFSDRAAAVADDALRGEGSNDDLVLMLVRFEARDRLSLEIPRTTRDAQRARRAVERLLSCSPLDEDRKFGFLVAVGEAVNNAVEHGSQSADDVVRIMVTCGEEGVSAVIHDCGRWKHERSQSIERGRGVPLMHALTDEIDFDTGDVGSIVRLFVAAENGRENGAGRAEGVYALR
jgi:PAS domain S-box-containing protein